MSSSTVHAIVLVGSPSEKKGEKAATARSPRRIATTVDAITCCLQGQHADTSGKGVKNRVTPTRSPMCNSNHPIVSSGQAGIGTISRPDFVRSEEKKKKKAAGQQSHDRNISEPGCMPEADSCYAPIANYRSRPTTPCSAPRTCRSTVAVPSRAGLKFFIPWLDFMFPLRIFEFYFKDYVSCRHFIAYHISTPGGRNMSMLLSPTCQYIASHVFQPTPCATSCP